MHRILTFVDTVKALSSFAGSVDLEYRVNVVDARF